jgi:MerR family regulatory protein
MRRRSRFVMPMRRVDHFKYARSQVTAVQDERRSSRSPTLLTIGELAERAGVPTTSLRYYDELGLVRPAVRESGGAAATPRQPAKKSA